MASHILFSLFAIICLYPIVRSADPSHHHHHSSAESSPEPISKMMMDNPHKAHPMDDQMDMGGNMSMHMKMYFHFGVTEYVLFYGWKTTTVGEMIAAVVGVFILGMLYESLKYFREYLFKKYISKIQFSTVAVTGENGKATQVHKVEKHHIFSWAHTLQTFLHIVQIIVSYFLMLIFMTYNVWLCLGVVLGAGVGYFAFGWRKATVVDITEHCH